jgi:predicted nucleic acid-binding protein
MSESLVVVDTSSLLYLHQANNLDLLQKLYGTITVPLAVQEELEIGKQRGFDVPEVSSIKWIHICSIASAILVPAAVDLGQGEAEVIALALETTNSLLVLDDLLAQRIASLYQLNYTGTLDVLVKAKQTGYIPSLAAVINMLRAKGVWLNNKTVSNLV